MNLHSANLRVEFIKVINSNGDQIKKDGMDRTCSAHWEMKNAYILVVKPEGKRILEIPRCRWEDIIKMHPREIGFPDVDWIHILQDRDRWRALVDTITKRRVPQNTRNFLTS
jgi:hypothetical protein